MTTALWIIAIVETIRMIEQSIQLRLIANDTGKRDDVYEELIKSFKASDREYVRNLLEAFDKQDEPQRDCDNLINAVVKLDMSREDKFKMIELLEQYCEKCKHYLFTDIDGHYCEHETYGQPCEYEPKGEPQTERSE